MKMDILLICSSKVSQFFLIFMFFFHVFSVRLEVTGPEKDPATGRAAVGAALGAADGHGAIRATPRVAPDANRQRFAVANHSSQQPAVAVQHQGHH